MSSRSFTILIVSPDRAQLRRLSRFLEAFGYDVRQAADSRQALTAAEAAPPDFLLLDAPGGQPAELQIVRQVRKLAAPAYTYTLLLTSDVEVGPLTEALEAGCDDFLARPVVFGELLGRLRAGARVIEFESRLARQTGIHRVTGLPDRTSLLSTLQRRLNNADAAEGWLAILDLDYFSRFGRQHGREPSNELLREVGQFLKSQCSDAHELAALGEDRFAALDVAGSLDNGLAWAERAMELLAQHSFAVAGQTATITASCGVTELRNGESVEDHLARAERALQLAKSSGRSYALASDQVEREAEEWAALAADGKLFSTTLARDVMTPCALLLHLDETIEQAHALADLTRLSVLAVVDNEGKLAGVITAAQLESLRSRSSKPRGGSSVRLVRHLMATDVMKFDEGTSLSKLMEFFTSEGAPFAIVVRDRRPKGFVHCQGLAALNERLTATHFARPTACTNTSEDLLVPDLAIAD